MSSLFVPFNSEWKFTGQEKDLTAHMGWVSTQQQLLKTLTWTSTMFSSDTSLTFEAVSIQSLINYNTELFQNARKGLASTWTQKLPVSPWSFEKAAFSCFQNKWNTEQVFYVTAGIFVFSRSKGTFQFKKLESYIRKYLLCDLFFRSNNKTSPILAATSIFLHISQPSGGLVDIMCYKISQGNHKFSSDNSNPL